MPSSADAEGEPAPLALQLAVRVEKLTPPTVATACAVAVLATIELLDDERSRPGGEWHEAVQAWNGARIRKLVRRGRASAWQRAQEVPGVTAERDGAEARAFVPGPVDAAPPEVTKLQIQSTPLDDVERVHELPLAASTPGAMVIAITPLFEMSWGKQAAQFAHAGQRLWMLATDAERNEWDSAGRPIVIVHADETLWARVETRATVSIHDGGFTEIPPGTNTTVAFWSAAESSVAHGTMGGVSDGTDMQPSEMARFDEVVRLGQDWAEPIVATIAAAFADDPVWRWIYHGDGEATLEVDDAMALARYMYEGMRAPREVHGFRHHQAVALWWAPAGTAAEPSDEETAARNARFGELMGRHLAARPETAIDVAALAVAMNASRPEEPHWYLSILATHPDRQSEGLGARVIQPMHDRCDRLGLPAYLESSNPANWSFYRRHGYVETSALEIGDCPTVMGFIRRPRQV